MAFPTNLGTMRSYMASLYSEDSSFPALTTAQKNDLINEMMVNWISEQNPSLQMVTGLSRGFNFITAGTGRANSNTHIQEILACHATAWNSGAVTGTPMERIELHEMIALQNSDLSQSSTPTKWATNRVYGAKRTRLWIHPFSDGTAGVAITIRDAIALLTSDLHIPPVSPEEIDYICRMAAFEGARLAGRSAELMESIIAPVPGRAEVIARKTKPLTKPTMRLQEEPV